MSIHLPVLGSTFEYTTLLWVICLLDWKQHNCLPTVCQGGVSVRGESQADPSGAYGAWSYAGIPGARGGAGPLKARERLAGVAG